MVDNQEPRAKRQERDRTNQRVALSADFLVLLLLGLGATLCYAAALARFPLLTIYAQPIQNLEKLTNADPWTGIALVGWTVLVFGGYAIGAIALAREAWEERQHAGERGRGGEAEHPIVHSHRRPLILFVVALIGFPLIFLVLLALVYPTTSVDLYDYMFRGRMLVRYQANTFIKIPLDFKDDPLFWYVAWRKAVTAYGPLWEGMSWLTARLGGEHPGLALVPPVEVSASMNANQKAGLLRLMLAYKGLAAIGFLGCGAAIWFTLRRTAFEWRWLGLYLWLWNPLALWESLAAGHNDAWMAMLIVLAVGAVSGRPADRASGRDSCASRAHSPTPALAHSLVAFLMLTLGGLVKFLALMFGPLLLYAGLRRLPDWRSRLRLVLLGGVICGAVVVLAYAPFWAGWGTLRNFSDRGTLFTSSWLAAIQAPLSLSPIKALIPARDLLALVTWGPPSEAISQAAAVSIGLGLLVFGVLWASWRAWRAPDDVARHVLWLLLWFLFLCTPWFQPWYLLWALALLAIQPWRGRMAWAIGIFCCTAMLSYLAGVFLLPLLGWNGDGAEWNGLTSALIYGPPLLALLWGRRPGLAWPRVRLRHKAVAPAEEMLEG